MKYANLAELRAAYADGELDPQLHRLVLDNDCSSVYDDSGEVYSGGGPQELAQEALDLLGVPWENA